MYAHRRAADRAPNGAYAGAGAGMKRSRKTFGPGPDTLLCDGRPVAPLAVAEDSATRGRGLLGSDGVEGALFAPKPFTAEELMAKVHMLVGDNDDAPAG